MFTFFKPIHEDFYNRKPYSLGSRKVSKQLDLSETFCVQKRSILQFLNIYLLFPSLDFPLIPFYNKL